ncbi:C2H2 finger domain protein [Aspergillus sclerotiicarbonarius CBS 121057]|uniref:C2H2 finger domain protein n=1 Tax=Aspergillus sclerotiicarbonarius (strain CBS 121057 / IBT 28362) TaxID=1448318 RepID=A0A319FA31_ASPSB|nr:C2H2 finger domain protein [Aspergillus sclerotiicarbonarius CBS 121057]
MPVTASSRVRCTFEDCRRHFESLPAMRQHKLIEHDYCSRCDEDFKDEECFLLHKIRSDKHIVCAVCGREFRSEGGRDAHIRQYHRPMQSLTCSGCGQKFKQAGALVRHVEDDECNEIPMTRLLHEQSKRLLIREALKTGEGDGLPFPDPDGLDEVDGGVKLNASSLLDMDSDNDKIMSPASQRSTMTSQDPLPEMRRLSINSGVSNNSKGRATSVAGSSKQDNSDPFGVNKIDAGHTIRSLDKTWDPMNFFDSFRGKFVCSCEDEFLTIKDFENHVIEKTNGKRSMQCPGCLRIFKTAAALVAHCESASTHCSVNTGLRFSQIITDVSGGLVKAVGLRDGAVEYVTGDLDLTKKVSMAERKQDMMKW